MASLVAPRAGDSFTMNAPTLRPTDRRLGLTRAERESLRHRAELPALSVALFTPFTMRAAHDFLVPNPRLDLTHDLHTLRMVEPW